MNVSAVLDILSNAMANGQASSVFSRFVGATGIYGAVHSGLNFIMGLI